jgi:hypothetical protein
MDVMASTTVDNVPETPTLWRRIVTTFELIGYARAAEILASRGYYKEAKQCREMAKSLKE